MKTRIKIQTAPFDLGPELEEMSQGAGALATFTGHVRGEDGIETLMLEHYPGMAEREIARHIDDAARRWPLLGVTVIHRVGELKPGERIVLVAVAASHRREAFAACEFLMDHLKTTAAFWKQEQRGTETRWVEAKASDDNAAKRWK
ncbi:MAG: molybdenum cofactor biosynthesis protein MoaE [Alphaproteobacteria bacterium]|nr:molybdenum cofactor biosynthesis protein MoaE [Alphaproteobacteria bacterium]MDE1984971.1 molybdenum cofactor biosynthesis protein MoaE [Alphaproteobacteria bacterium]MDE2162315.1 molybdenum cofactor biosynthesis protein MoaE [Alphaproteobacteria bacterium]MDE2264594.1 molybdenum cofactor biosynthesis protein MoaE [Alphaproteobacteria bacterium]MDE2498899.1 molybdenum cofactor biosynthesis protein MoaE [Alphaproteobacteria bacterium]